MSTYTPIASITLGSAQSSVTFSNIPQTYTDLVIVMSYQRSVSGNGLLRFNSDTGSNYSYTYLLGDGSSASSSRGSNQTSGILSYDSANLQETCLVNIFNYANTTTNKSFFTRGNDTGLGVITYMNLWRSTSAITSIELRPNSGNWNSNSTFNLYGIANASITNTAKATGGDSVTTDGTYWYHTFRSSGTFTPTQALTADYLVVAGGAGGGTVAAAQITSGGGGAGGLRSTVTATGGGGSLESALSLTANTSYTVTVGAGGTKGTYPAKGGSGSNSVFSTITSTGGGGGGAYDNKNGNSGGSGGGGAHVSGTGGAGTANQGYAGGTGSSTDGYGASGGGGGAGATGANATVGASAGGGAGGAGVAVAISGSSVTYAGGGGGGSTTTGGGASGGSGGGGTGATRTIAGTDGTANTGSGGGGGSYYDVTERAPGNGGSGIVIVRYAV